MTTKGFINRAGPTAQALNTVYELFTKGTTRGTFACPKCGGRVTFTALLAHKSSGQCSTSGCIRWNS